VKEGGLYYCEPSKQPFLNHRIGTWCPETLP
jgi:hypothetical protein